MQSTYIHHAGIEKKRDGVELIRYPISVKSWVLGDLEYSEFKGFESVMFAIYFLETLLGRMNRELHRYVCIYVSFKSIRQ